MFFEGIRAGIELVDYDNTTIAERYDRARQLPEATLEIWLDAIAELTSGHPMEIVLDVGCGTGRFSAGLADRLGAVVIGMDPSDTMLREARRKAPHPDVKFCNGRAEGLPFIDRSLSLVFLSMVFHHLSDQDAAIREFKRALDPDGLVCIRNSTTDLLNRVPYLKYFPRAEKINRKRLPSKQDVVRTMEQAGFSVVEHRVIQQHFASSFSEYCQKIGRRALSDLVHLSDADFEAGLLQMKQAVKTDAEAGPILEPVDLFVFQKVEQQNEMIQHRPPGDA